jgi:hypothetical protein
LVIGVENLPVSVAIAVRIAPVVIYAATAFRGTP